MISRLFVAVSAYYWRNEFKTSIVEALEALTDPVDGFLESTICKFEIALLYNNSPDCGCDEKDPGYQVRGIAFCGTAKRFLLSAVAT